MTFYLPQPADGASAEGGGALDLVAGERLPAVLHGQAVLTNPHGNLLSGKPFFGVEGVLQYFEDDVCLYMVLSRAKSMATEARMRSEAYAEASSAAVSRR